MPTVVVWLLYHLKRGVEHGSPFYGGEDIFKDYCTEAGIYGMKVLEWEHSGYLGGRSPIVMKHPDWAGDYDDAYCGSITNFTSAQPH